MQRLVAKILGLLLMRLGPHNWITDWDSCYGHRTVESVSIVLVCCM